MRKPYPCPFHIILATIFALISLAASSTANQLGTLAIGERDTVNNISGAGAVHILKRTPSGLTGELSQHWHQGNDGTGSQLENDDRFGSSLSYGDFNGDGFIDLAIGAPNEEIAGKVNAGAIHVLYGTPEGLSATNSDMWIKLFFAGSNESDEFLGQTVCSGDFNNDGFDDLAASAPLADDGAIENAGIVHLFYGSGDGLAYIAPMSGIKGSGENSLLGWSLSSGDYNNDGYMDLAMGEYSATVNEKMMAGAVQVWYGSNMGLTILNAQFWTQDALLAVGASELLDGFGSSLASADFNKDGFKDLAIGAKDEGFLGTDEGTVHIIYGSEDGLTAAGNQQFRQNTWWGVEGIGVGDIAEDSDYFGEALSTGDFNGDFYQDLVVTVRGEDLDGINNVGAFHVLFGSASGLNPSGSQFISRKNLENEFSNKDRFAETVASGDFNLDGYDDVAVGAPNRTVNGKDSAGAVYIYFGSAAGIHDETDQYWTKESDGITGDALEDARFGIALAAYAPPYDFPWPVFLPAIMNGKNSSPPPPASFSLISSSFINNQDMDIRYTLYGANISPQLSWENAPAETDHFLLTVIDIDANNWIHWKVELPGHIASLDENAGAAGGGNLPAGTTRMRNTFGRLDYDGPQPPPGSGEHRYVFSIEAQDADDNILAITELLGRFEK